MACAAGRRVRQQSLVRALRLSPQAQPARPVLERRISCGAPMTPLVSDALTSGPLGSGACGEPVRGVGSVRPAHRTKEGLRRPQRKAWVVAITATLHAWHHACHVEVSMHGDVSTPSSTPIDVRCRQPGCPCATRAPGTIVKDGSAVAPEAGPRCPVCQHPWSDHESLGLAKGPIETGEPIT
jgi:hypothetical protein